MTGPNLLHATVVVVEGRGILIRGPSGSGKSSLALSLLRRAEAVGLHARLVADDQIFVSVEGVTVLASVPASIAGLIEVRGVGLLREPFEPSAVLHLVVDLEERERIERLPDPATAEIGGVGVPRIRLPARDPAFGADVLLSVLRSYDQLVSDETNGDAAAH